jgi:chloride channel protein, CIC family
MPKKTILRRFLTWRVKYISPRQFMMLMSVLVGFSVGIAAVIIKNSVHFIQNLLTSGFAINYHNYLYFAYPTIGILIAVLFIKYIIKRPVRHGIPSVLYAISKNSGVINRHNMFSSVVTSAFTVGFGGSVGLEGPTVATGAAIGSNIGRLFRLNYKQITLLLGCACAGAMASIFKAPIAAIVFAIEVIMLDLTMASMVSLLFASVTAALTSYAFLGQNVLYPVEIVEHFKFADLPFYILLGLFAGLVSTYFTRMYMIINKTFDKIKGWVAKLVIGGSALGILIFFFPSLYGEGYEAINTSLQGNFDYLFDKSIYYDYIDNFAVLILLLFAIILLKVIATAVTFGSGGIGGIFAPSLFLGANVGLLFSKIANYFNFNISESNFALVGMAGVIAGVIHAPLTAIFMIAEITGGYELFMPLMITSTISYATTRIFEPNSVYTILLAKRGELITHDKDKALLTLMKVDKLIETNFSIIGPDATLGELVKTISTSTRNIFPVVDEENSFIGIVFLDHVRHIIFDPELYDSVFVRDLMYMPQAIVDPSDSMEDVTKKFQTSGNFNLPVIKDGKYIGFVSKANVFESYRKLLKHFSED